jgi:zinc transport system ATP-binding protein
MTQVSSAAPRLEVVEPPAAPALVEIRNLRVERGGNAILRGVNLDIPRGQITALIGLNGSGKTTLLRALVKEYPCTGEIRFRCGHDHTEHQPRHVGYVPQRLHADNRIPVTVEELFALALQRRPLFLGISKRVAATTTTLLARVGASQLRVRPVHALSGGELQRILLALALEPKPELLLLDEPAAGVDFADQQGFYDLLAGLNRESKTTLLLVSHDLSVVTQHAHHVVCLRNGQIACSGSPQHILSEEMMAKTFGSDKRLYLHDHEHSHDHEHTPGCGH